MKRLLLAVPATLIMALLAAPASAEGHMCRHWYPSNVYGGYWLWIDCPQDAGDEKWGNWYADLPWYEWNSDHLDIREPVDY